MPNPPLGRTELYPSVCRAEAVSPVTYGTPTSLSSVLRPEGVTVGEWVTRTAPGLTAFYDIDTPVTFAKLERGDTNTLPRTHPPLRPLPLVHRRAHAEAPGASTARRGRPSTAPWTPSSIIPSRRSQWDLGYLGTYSADRQPPLERLMLEPARRCRSDVYRRRPAIPRVIAGPPTWSRSSTSRRPSTARFYNAHRFTLNITRADMIRAGYSPSVRLFEAAACGVPIS